MKKHIVLHIISGILIAILLMVGFSLKNTILLLEVEVSELETQKQSLEEEAAALQQEKNNLSDQITSNENMISVRDNQIAELNKDIESDNYYRRMKSLYTSNRGMYSRELIELLATAYQSKKGYFKFYGPDDQAMYVRPSYYLPVQGDDVMEQLEFIADSLIKYTFTGQIIVVEGIEVIDGKKIANIDIRDPEGYEGAFTMNFLMGSTAGIMTADTLIETFLQRETELDEWVDGIHFSYEGERDWISDHDPSICRYTYYRDGTSVEDE